MGTTNLVVNTAKRQYFRPLGDAKLHGLFWGIDGNALAQLIAGAVDPDLFLDSWSGDPLVLVGDEPDPCQIPALRSQTEDDVRSGFEIVTQEFDDITLNVVALMCQRESIADDFFDDAQLSDTKFIILAHIAMYLSPPVFVKAFEQRFGKDWRARYKRAIETCYGFHPMPMTEATRKNSRAVDEI